MLVLLTIVHVVICLFLIIVILLQSGKAADLAGAFGGMGSQTTFGPRGSATVLSKATTVSAVIFMITSMSLSIIATRSSGGENTVLDQSKPVAPVQTPATNKTTIPTTGNVPVTVTPETGKTQTPPAAPAQKSTPAKK